MIFLFGRATGIGTPGIDPGLELSIWGWPFRPAMFCLYLLRDSSDFAGFYIFPMMCPFGRATGIGMPGIDVGLELPIWGND